MKSRAIYVDKSKSNIEYEPYLNWITSNMKLTSIHSLKSYSELSMYFDGVNYNILGRFFGSNSIECAFTGPLDLVEKYMNRYTIMDHSRDMMDRCEPDDGESDEQNDEYSTSDDDLFDFEIDDLK